MKEISHKVTNNHQYIEDAGLFPLNSSSFFHFISVIVITKGSYYENFYFISFNLIRLETYFQAYENDKDLSKYNHWIYGFCDKEADIKGIENLITHQFFSQSACIKKYHQLDIMTHFFINKGCLLNI